MFTPRSDVRRVAQPLTEIDPSAAWRSCLGAEMSSQKVTTCHGMAHQYPPL